jgi:acyl transferase domain-containing protein
VVPTLRRGEHDWTAMLATLARVYVQGVPVNWTAFQKGQRLSPVRLPNYPFQRSRHWYEGPLVKSQSRATIASNGSAGHPLLGRRLRLPGSAEIRFQSIFSQSAPHFLNDHRLFGVSLPPAACHFAMLAQAAEFLGGTQGNCYRFEALNLLRPMLLPDGCEREVQLIFKPDAHGWSLELTSSDSGEAKSAIDAWTPHMIGFGRVLNAENFTPATPTMDLGAIKARCTRELSRGQFYSKIWANQGGTGSAFRWIESIWQGDHEAVCLAACPTSVADAANYRVHPGLIEAACQVLHCCAAIETEEALQQSGMTFVPFSVDVLSLFEVTASHSQAWCYAQLREHSNDNVLADLSVLNASGELVAQLVGFRLRPITQQAVGASTQRGSMRPYRQPQPSSTPGPAVDVGNSVDSVQATVRYLQAQCAELSGYPESAIHSDQGFMAMGLDSLVAMVLSNRIRHDFGCAVSASQILMSASIESLARLICPIVAA